MNSERNKTGLIEIYYKLLYNTNLFHPSKFHFRRNLLKLNLFIYLIHVIIFHEKLRRNANSIILAIIFSIYVTYIFVT